jgi:branched-chain amino acid transport system permease protein
VRVSHLAWATAGGLAGAAGALLAPLYTVYPTSGDSALVKGFVVVVLGGLGSIGGPLIAGLLVGLVEAFGAVYGNAAYTDAYGFAFMILVLLIIPTGLFGRTVREL